MAREYVPIFFDWTDTTQDLSQEEKGNLIDAVILYASGSDEWIDKLEGAAEKVAFRFMRGQIDRNEKISDVRSRAGSNKQEQNETNEIKQETKPNKPEQSTNKTKQTETKSLKEEEEKEEKEKEEDKKREKEKEKESRSARFDLFWSLYPRKVGKEDARKAFDKLNPDDETLNIILAAIGKQKVSSQWTENGGQFIPHPSTWLNGKRWNDDVVNYQSSKPPAPVKKTSQDYEQRDPDMAQDAARRQFMAMMMEAGVT